MQEEAKTFGRAVMPVMRNELEPVTYTGALGRSISTAIKLWGARIFIEVGPTAKHAKYVRYGTRPHWAPIAPLIRWATWKLGDPKAAYAVRWSIHEYGTSRFAEWLYGTKANPYEVRTLARPETQSAMHRFLRDVNVRLAWEAYHGGK